MFSVVKTIKWKQATFRRIFSVVKKAILFPNSINNNVSFDKQIANRGKRIESIFKIINK